HRAVAVGLHAQVEDVPVLRGDGGGEAGEPARSFVNGRANPEKPHAGEHSLRFADQPAGPVLRNCYTKVATPFHDEMCRFIPTCSEFRRCGREKPTDSVAHTDRRVHPAARRAAARRPDREMPAGPRPRQPCRRRPSMTARTTRSAPWATAPSGSMPTSRLYSTVIRTLLTRTR